MGVSEITRMVFDASGKELSIQSAASLMTKLSDPGRSSIGHFIIKNKTPEGYAYSLVPEILNLAPEEIYDLTRKTGKDRFTLEKAIEKVPGLGQYIKSSPESAGKKKPAIKRSIKKKTASRKKPSIKKNKAKPGKLKAIKKEPSQAQEMEMIESPVQKAGFKEFVADFLSEIKRRRGGLKVNFYLKVRVEH